LKILEDACEFTDISLALQAGKIFLAMPSRTIVLEIVGVEQPTITEPDINTPTSGKKSGWGLTP
jgi:hypothetical protein